MKNYEQAIKMLRSASNASNENMYMRHHDWDRNRATDTAKCWQLI